LWGEKITLFIPPPPYLLSSAHTVLCVLFVPKNCCSCEQLVSGNLITERNEQLLPEQLFLPVPWYWNQILPHVHHACINLAQNI
jgi:hypothetical protein